MQTQLHDVVEVKTRGPTFAETIETIGLYVTDLTPYELYATLLATVDGIGTVPDRFIRTDETEGDQGEIST